MDASGKSSSESFGTLSEGSRHYLLLLADRELGADLKAKVGADDLVQEALVGAQQSVHTLKGTTGQEVRAWLRRILLNRIVDVARRYRNVGKRELCREQHFDPQKARDSAIYADPSPTPFEQAVAKEQKLALERAMARLSFEYREVIRLHCFEGLRFTKVAAELERSAEASQKLWRRAIKQLRKDLDADRET